MLAPGTRLGPYKVIALVGTGGMGEVYRATDINLTRQVAIKVLPHAFANDPERLARFEREAKTLAALNHPNIAQIYGFEKGDGIRTLVMELVEGPTLADRIAQGPISLDEVLPIAKQIAEALEAAHEQGIIHRDLKPANIKLRPDGTVKVLDFGLAKALEPPSGTHVDATASPTITSPAMMTGVGMLLGTAAYMSPEQARGKPVDKRSDIWAFGCVFYEMLTGTRAFDADEVAAVLARVIERQPNWNALPASVPWRVRELLRLCLEKNPKRRRQAAGDVRIDLEQALVEPTTASTTAIPPAPRRMWIPAIAASVVTSILGGVVVWLVTRPVPQPVWRFTISPRGPEQLSVGSIDRNLVLTPDGTHVVYRAANGTALYARPIDALEGRRLATGEIRGPFVSPDGRWVGFTDGLTVMSKVGLAGGPVVTIGRIDSGNMRGAVWLPDDTIIFAGSNLATGLHRVSAGGGAVMTLTRPDRSRGEVDHLWPEALPGGQAILYTILTEGGLDASQIAVLDLTNGTSRVVLRGGSHGTYVPTGHLLYGTGGNVLAVAFDLATREPRGTPMPVLSRVVTTREGALDMTVADGTGTLVYVELAGAAAAPGARSMVWVDRQGQEEAIAAPPRTYTYPRISPDGTRLVVAAADQEADLWSWDFARQALTRLTFTPTFDSYVEWMPDGRRVVFRCDGTGDSGMCIQSADGTGAVERLIPGPGIGAPSGVSPDGRQLLFTAATETTKMDLIMMAVDGTRAVRPLIKTQFNEGNGVVSPDGRWLVYQGDDTGRWEVYARPWPNVDTGKWQVSTGGGTRPLWGPGGRELFYVSADGALMRVAVENDAKWAASAATRLLDGPFVIGGSPGRTFDISRDGRRFLMIREGGTGRDATPPQLVVVKNWFEELKRLVPTN